MFRYILRSYTHRRGEIGISQALAQDAVEQFPGAIAITDACLGQKVGRARHAFRAAGKIQLAVSTLQSLHRGYDCLQATSANAIDGLRSHVFRKTGIQSDLAGGIHPAARLQNIADNHICDVFCGKSGQDRLGCNNTQLHRRGVS